MDMIYKSASTKIVLINAWSLVRSEDLIEYEYAQIFTNLFP